MPGPLPNAQKRHRGPTLPTTQLPFKGRTGKAPSVPARFKLQKAGRAWWAWAWKLPQATMWDKGTVYFAARRAELEDHAAALEMADQIDLVEVVNAGGYEDLREKIKNLEWAIGKLRSSATGSVALMKEMRELDNRLGLNPKAMADLRWSIEEKPAAENAAGVANLDAYRDRVA